MEGGLKEELWVELRKLVCVRYDGAARAGLGEAGNWWQEGSEEAMGDLGRGRKGRDYR